MPELLLQKIRASHKSHLAVDRVDLRLANGEIGCLLGPSGCGKTTLLRTIAGLHPIEGGEISIAGELMSTPKKMVSTEERHIGMVFQDYALFPHMTIYDNIAFGLDGKTQQEKKQRIEQLLSLIGLPEVGKRYPHQLSGGQQQRVALARALAPKPKILLMDEPFSGLDVELRESLAREVRDILKTEGISALMVTHNQNEAFAMADSVGVLKDGKLLQWDTPYNLYHQPHHPFIADFIGQGSLISGSVCDCRAVHTELGLLKTHLPTGTASGEEVMVLVRPDDIIHDDESDWQLEVVNRAFRGSHFLFTLKLPSGEKVMCMSQSHHDHPVGSKIGIQLEMDHAIVFAKNLVE
ncbi:ABC transporter ATP-binding protein [Thiomicrorhabdus indica]|uniref:ABC transporter ATP-binding protein n=1 Tax=Thiomicrorhabdus indica TaxID=2267253 RepID=UPI00102D872F|nr:ABC transporter ATP-binding protein [Thiomicrorhabdus indica]